MTTIRNIREEEKHVAAEVVTVSKMYYFPAKAAVELTAKEEEAFRDFRL